MSNVEKNKYRIEDKMSIETIDNIQAKTSSKISETFNVDKEKLKRQLEKATNVEERVKLFSKLMDTFGLEAIIGLIPEIGDLTPAIISTCYLLAEGINIGLSRIDCLKILGYQTMDIIVGAIPLIGDIADFFFKSNKYSAKIFSKHLEKLKQVAIAQGISPEEIDNIGNKEKKFIKTMDKYIDYKSKKKKKST